jgi:hypothetical protein
MKNYCLTVLVFILIINSNISSQTDIVTNDIRRISLYSGLEYLVPTRNLSIIGNSLGLKFELQARINKNELGFGFEIAGVGSEIKDLTLNDQSISLLSYGYASWSALYRRVIFQKGRYHFGSTVGIGYGGLSLSSDSPDDYVLNEESVLLKFGPDLDININNKKRIRIFINYSVIDLSTDKLYRSSLGGHFLSFGVLYGWGTGG